MKRFFSRENLPAILLLVLGAVLRLRQYFTGRSLWLDEAMLALNIVNRNFAGMFQPLDYDQGAPIGFLLIEKFFNVLLGRHELVLRLFPLIAGLAALWLFYLLLKPVTSSAGLLVALALFALNPQLIYYSSESKQYIVDVAVTVGLLVLALPALNQRANEKEFLWLGLAGFLALWLSHPALFVLAGIGFMLLIQYWQKRDWGNLRITLMLGILWSVSFILLYVINLRKLNANPFLTNFWSDAFLPMPPWSDLSWFQGFIIGNTRFQLGMNYGVWFVALLVGLGWFGLYQSHRRVAITLTFITCFALIASALRLYPVLGRLALFTAPLVTLLLGQAVDVSTRLFRSTKAINVALTVSISTFLIYSPLITSMQTFITPKYFEHIRPFMDYLSSVWKPDDEIFLSYGAKPAFLYYEPFYHLENIHYFTSQYEDYTDLEKLKTRFDPLIGKKRVWVLFSHVYEKENFNEKDFLISYLDSLGKQTRQIRIPDTSVYLYLYDLSK